jgi:hypothetical protein
LQDEAKELPKRPRVTLQKVVIETFWILCGIVLPLAAIIVEKLTEICARSFFDPTPTDAHLLLISLIPITNLIGELLRIPRFAARFSWLASPLLKWINGMAIGVGGFYAVWFFPVTSIAAIILVVAGYVLISCFFVLPFVAIAELIYHCSDWYTYLQGRAWLDTMGTLSVMAGAVFWVGLCMLPMAPIFSVLACYRTRSTLFSLTAPVVPDGSKRAGFRSIRRLFLPVACGLLALLAIEIPSTATRVAMDMAADPETSANGLLLLRAFGNEDSMLRMCYERSHATDIIGSILTLGRPVPYTKARELYYRATGRPFNSRGIPASFRGKINDWSEWTGADDVFDSDAELAGETVGGVVRGVTLTHSEMTGVVDSVGNAATINWDMEFNNESRFQREARAQILLPPHGVVSNVLLWINGEPRPAAFGSRGLTRAAYRAVVQKKRDPLLVTTYGPDRVLAQCFPVPPGGKMHIQIGITAPLAVEPDTSAFLTMPMFLERNFQVDRHSIHLRATGLISNPGHVLELNQSWGLDGNISNNDLSQGKATVFKPKGAHSVWSWHRDSVENGNFIVQTIEPTSTRKLDRLVIVVDGSAALAEDATKIAQALKNVPPGIELTLLRAGDKVERVADNISSSSAPAWTSALANLQCQTFVGGQDDTQALLAGLSTIGNREHSAILWLHGPQPAKIDDPAPLAEKLRVAGSNVFLYELQLENGPNRTIEALDGIANVSRIPVVVSPLATLDKLFSTWNTNSVQFEPILKQENLKLVSDQSGESQVDLSPLWANERVGNLRQSGNPTDLGEALELAKRYRVVTPVSGAVVLETQMDYQKYGLKAPSETNNLQPKEGEQAGQQSPSAGSDSARLAAPPIPGADLFTATPEPRDWVLFFCVLGCLALVNRHRWLPLLQHER